MIRGLGKDYRPLVRALIEAGWDYLPPSQGGHPSVVSPGGARVYFPGSPSDSRAIRNTRAKIRRVMRAEGLDHHID